MKKLQKITLAFLLTVSSSHFMHSMDGEPVDTTEKEQQQDDSGSRDIAPIGAKIGEPTTAQGENSMNRGEGSPTSGVTDEGDKAEGEGVDLPGDDSSEKSFKDRLAERSSSWWKRLIADPLKSMKERIRDFVNRLLGNVKIQRINGHDVLQKAKNMVDVTRASEILRSVGERAQWTKAQFDEARQDFASKLSDLVKGGRITAKEKIDFMKRFVADRTGSTRSRLQRALDPYKKDASKFLSKKARQAKAAAKAARTSAQNLFQGGSGAGSSAE